MNLVFDLDNTLVDCADLHYESLNLALVKNGYEAIRRQDHLDKYNGLPTNTKLEMLGVKDKEQVWKDKQDLTLEAIKVLNVDRELIKLLKILKAKNNRLFCVSNSIKPTIEAILKQVGIYDLFDGIISCDEVDSPKPFPDVYLEAKQRFGLGGNTFCFEDNGNGWSAVLGARMNLVKVENPQNLKEILLLLCSI